MKNSVSKNHFSRLSVLGVLISLGIVYGDIGTSPLYVFRAIINGSGVIDDITILGGISCIFWTLTLQTTVKYVIITLRADNKGEGGIFSLYALVRRKAKWAFVFAIIGGSTLLADGVITPAITVVSAVEGLEMIYSGISVLPIVLIIIALMFGLQRIGTQSLGASFGPVMLIWFSMLAIVGISHLIGNWHVLAAVNPVWGYKLLTSHPEGFLLLGAVFLATTGAEALYSDLGHCGRHNIRVSWIFVKTSLLLNYFGQGAWALNNPKEALTANPFFAMMPDWFLLPGIILATLAAIIASQALISGSFSIISEAILLNFWPKVQIKYPAQVKGQMFIPSINLFLWLSCTGVILMFRESEKMEAAYGLAITITMLMTTVLLGIYFRSKNISPLLYIPFVLLFLTIEGSFLGANLNKFAHGGWVTILISGILFVIMFVWFKGREIKKRFLVFEKLKKYDACFIDLKNDVTVQKTASQLVYITMTNHADEIESKIIQSIFLKQPKRADRYWLIHIDILDTPRTMDYKVQELIPDTLTRIDFHLGFKVQPRINLYFRKIVDEMVKTGEIVIDSPYPSLRKHEIPGDFKFVLIDRIQNYDFDFKPFEQLVMDLYNAIKHIGIPDVKAYGLDTSSVYIEKVPLQNPQNEQIHLKRI
jgi:KUP system potassium uptake protein